MPGGPGAGSTIMVELELEEKEVVRIALEQRKRSSGVGTADYDRCKRVLIKLEQAGMIRKPTTTDVREAVTKA